LELRFVTVHPNGEIMVGDRVPSAEASAAKQPMRRRKTAGG
jgi:hypothetical protein